MSTSDPSRTPPKSLADVLAALQANQDLPDKRRHELCSAIRVFCRAHGQEPAQVAADVQRLRPRLAGLTPAGAGVGAGRLRNLRSLFGQALRLAGVTRTSRRQSEPIPEPWGGLLRRVEDRYERSKLARLARYCAARSIAPGHVDDGVLAAFGAFLHQELIPRPKQVHRDAALAWNRCATMVSGWPGQRVSVPDHRRVYAMAPTAFPPGLQADFESYMRGLADPDPFSDRKQASPVTICTRRIQLLELATAAVESGCEASSLTSLAALVEAETAKAALSFLWERNGRRKTGQLHNFARLLVGVARHFVRVPETQLAALKAMQRKLDPGKGGLTDRNKARLRQFTDPVNVARLVNLPDALLRTALNQDPPGYNDAVLLQSAVAIAIVLAAPIRAKNLAALRFDRHIVRARIGAGAVTQLVLPVNEVKNDTPLEFALPGHVVRLIELYRSKFLPLLGAATTPFLFPARKGGSKDPGPFAVQLKRAIQSHAGLDLNLHAFRHLAAFLYLRAHPGEYETVRLLLGHKSLATTIRFYCGLEQSDAFRRYDDMLDRYRTDPAARQRGDRARAP